MANTNLASMSVDALLKLRDDRTSAPTRRPVKSTGRDLPPRDQLTKAPDYGAGLVAITVAQSYLSCMLQRILPAGFIALCLPTKTDKLPSGDLWLHEIKHDGFRIIARQDRLRVRLYSRPGNDLSRRFPLIVETLARLAIYRLPGQRAPRPEAG